jgi:hypothetical protein
MRILLSALLLGFLHGGVIAQDARGTRDSLSVLFAQMRSGDDSDRMMAATRVEQLLTAWFMQPTRFATDLDSLPFLGQLRSSDGRLLLVCWNLVREEGALRYHCIAFIRDGKKAMVTAVPLEHNETDWQKITRKTIAPQDWYGALYYRIITNRYKKKTYYTLLGWDGHNEVTNRKVVDVLNVESGRLSLGAPMFSQDRRPAYRLVYEYANDATMSLNWDDQQKMIVMDHLAPEDGRLKGQFQFYGPDFSYDALRFEKGKWLLIEDLDARNRGLNNLRE